MKFLRPFLALLATAAFVFAAETPKPRMAPAEAAKLVKEGKAVLVDCREPSEWQASGVAAPAVLLPKSDFDGDQKQWKEFLAKNSGQQVILYCASGRRSGMIAAALEEKGVKAANVGGFKDWKDAGLPVRQVGEKEKK